ncbi:hypothetical protein RB623_20930 [Mesorhizobium sp. LHD-90]|uniref:hypothetical protein n=1 Tax=Mesorhizobium sp. LHD-90 TaxID=3071414 RepID=UPI0027E00141|nr:hypothetical protein [Mesorhizobium sp. LHD-90]MDQ6436522.1 hypothetical protein [Mesorhizobium sp. LHD-90]
MIRYPTVPKSLDADSIERDMVLDPVERAEIERAIEAVCAELGLGASVDERRTRIAFGIKSTWRDGRRLPLNLVSAGLDAVGA